MAWVFGGFIGSGNTKTLGTSLTFTTTNAVPSGAQLVCTVSAIGSLTQSTDATVSVGTANLNVVTTSRPGAGNIRFNGVYYQSNAVAQSAGVTVTVTFAVNQTAAAASVSYFTGGGSSATPDVSGVNSGTSTTPSLGSTLTPTVSGDLWIGLVSVNGATGDTYTEATGWTGLTRAGTSGGSAASNVTNNSAYIIATDLTAHDYNPTLGTSRAWLDLVATLKPPAAVGDGFDWVGGGYYPLGNN